MSNEENFENNKEQLLLDTHVLIWYMEGIKLDKNQITLIDKARANNSLYVSAISIWEIAQLASKEKIIFSIGQNDWINNVLTTPGLNLLELSVPILVSSCNLPNFAHKDPADRMIIASARYINCPLLTFDRKIIEYGDLGYVKTFNIIPNIRTL